VKKAGMPCYPFTNLIINYRVVIGKGGLKPHILSHGIQYQADDSQQAKGSGRNGVKWVS